MTPASDSTCWTLIHGAAAGNRIDRELFARQYAPVVRAYLGARWRRSPLAADIDDAVQDVFVECFRADGALDRADPARGSFRPFFYGVIRNVAARHEVCTARRRDGARITDLEMASREAELSRVFERAWAQEIMRQAAQRQADRAHERGDAAVRRVELLRLRFQEGLPIRSIAERWNVDRDWLHHEYAAARQEFRAALLELIAFHNPASAPEIELEAAELFQYLQS